MRYFAAALLLLWAGPALAQSVQDQVAEIIIADTVAQDIDQAIAEGVAACVATRMTEDEATAFLAADGAIEQQTVVASMGDYTNALVCIAEAVE